MAIVCWSGGLDSTLVLCDLARAMKDGHAPDKHGVRALSIVHEQVPCQPQARIARASLRVRFKEMGLRFDQTTVALKSSGRFQATRGSGLAQPLFWLGIAVSYLEEDEDLYMGYVHGDCVWHYSDHLKAAFGGLQGVGGRTGKLCLPLEWLRKVDVILKCQDLGLYDHCWWCEGDQADLVKLEHGRLGPCGRCPACETHGVGLWLLEQAKARAVALTTLRDKGEEKVG